MPTKEPSLTKHPIVQKLVFHVVNCPSVTITSSSTGRTFKFTPDRVTAEKRDRGIRLVVEGRNEHGYRRERNFNIEGYDNYEYAPNWLVLLWEAAKEEVF